MIKGQLGLMVAAKRSIDEGTLESLELMLRTGGWWDMGLVGTRAVEVKWVNTIRPTAFGRQIGSHIARDPAWSSITSAADLATSTTIRKPSFYYVRDVEISTKAKENVIGAVVRGILAAPQRKNFDKNTVEAWVRSSIEFKRLDPPTYFVP